MSHCIWIHLLLNRNNQQLGFILSLLFDFGFGAFAAICQTKKSSIIHSRAVSYLFIYSGKLTAVSKGINYVGEQFPLLALLLLDRFPVALLFL